MHLTKYLHSCLLIEQQQKTVLIDPGIFTYEERVFPIGDLTKLDAIAITHEHPDHCHVPFIKALVTKFPNVQILSNDSVIKKLATESIAALSEETDAIKLTAANHERVFDVQAPANVLLEVFDKLAHPGDSMSFNTDKPILALPLLGPSWMITQAVEKALEIKPKYVLPIHDYHWKDTFRKEYYKRLETFFSQHNITFLPLETGEKIEISTT